jgi:hypothetical protein
MRQNLVLVQDVHHSIGDTVAMFVVGSDHTSGLYYDFDVSF